MICSHCQQPNHPATHFCVHCGASVASAMALRDRYAPTVVDEARQQEPLLQAAMREDLIGRTIAGKYRLEAQLGKGGMGAVYRARRLSIGDAVAVKVLLPKYANRTDIIKRFRIEAQAAARLHHPNAVIIYDFGVSDEGLMYLVMELLEGKSLREVLAVQGKLASTKVYKIISQICDALDEAHACNVVHRDLKPDNIVVAATTHGITIKVVDFGIAKLLNAAGEDDSLTRTGMRIGTPVYMSPEQFFGKAVDHRTDIYSLGVMLYQMLTGALPFRHSNPQALAAFHANGVLSLPESGIAPELQAVIRRAMAKNPDERYQSAGELAAALKAAIKNTASRPAIPSQPPAAAPAIPQSPPLVNAAAPPPLLLPSPPPAYALPAPVAASPAKTLAIVALLGLILLLAVILVMLWRGAAFSSGKQSSLSPPTTTLKPAPEAETPGIAVAELLGKAESDFRNARYQESIAACKEILSALPEHPKANLLAGQSYYNSGSSQGVAYLLKAIATGEKVRLAVKHHHYEGMLNTDDGFCAGGLIFQKSSVSFQADENREHNFSIALNQIAGLQNEAANSGRIHLKIPFRGALENFNIYPPVAGLLEGSLRTSAYCTAAACRPMAETIYQLLRQTIAGQ